VQRTPNVRRIAMKTILFAALIAASALTGAVSANADSFAVHGYQGTHYGN